MPWSQMLVAFLAGYGLMALVVSLFTWFSRLKARTLTVSAVVLAGNDEHRIEGVVRALNSAWNGGRLTEILIRIMGEDETKAIADRLGDTLPGVRVAPARASLEECLAIVQGQAVWLVDLAKIPPQTDPGAFVSLGRPGGKKARTRP